MTTEKQEDKVKIVLTRPALERLIGGDSEMEVQMRHTAAEAIFNKHIIPLIRKKPIQEIQNLIMDGIEAEMAQAKADALDVQEVKDNYGYKRKVAVLPDSVVKQIQKMVKDGIDEAIQEVAKAAIVAQEKHIERCVKNAVATNLSIEVKKRVRARFDKAMEED